MSFWKAFERKHPSRPVLKLDGGSLFSTGAVEAPLLNRFILEGVYRSGMDAVNLSSSDIPVWQELSDLADAGQVSREYMKIPLVSANVSSRLPNFPPVSRFILKEYPIGGRRIRVAITGLMFDQGDRISRDAFQVTNYQEAAAKVIEELMSKSDYRIMLTDLDIGRAISLSVGVAGINVIVVSRNYEAISEPQQVGETLMIIPVNEGRMLSEIRLGLARDSDKVNLETRFVPLDRKVPDDPAMAELERRAQTQLDAFQKGLDRPLR